MPLVAYKWEKGQGLALHRQNPLDFLQLCKKSKTGELKLEKAPQHKTHSLAAIDHA